MTYLFVKHLHISLAIASICFFCLRFAWAVTDDKLLSKKWVKIAPHVIDTCLLSAALYLLFSLQLSLLENPWLIAKITALLVYIGLGSLAIKRGKTAEIKAITGVLAILTYVFMINVAISRQPFIFF